MDLTFFAIVIMGAWVVGIAAAGLVMVLRPGGFAVPLRASGGPEMLRSWATFAAGSRPFGCERTAANWIASSWGLVSVSRRSSSRRRRF
jgi:hypothetical protein